MTALAERCATRSPAALAPSPLAPPTDSRLTHREDIVPTDVETPLRSRESCRAARDPVSALGYPHTSQCTWYFTVAYCDGAFRERSNPAALLVVETSRTRRSSLLGPVTHAQELA